MAAGSRVPDDKELEEGRGFEDNTDASKGSPSSG
jgi:hypothetical protein